MTEHDPLGKDAHEPGAKLDAGKPLPATVLGAFAPALQRVVAVGTDGARKYARHGWLAVPNGVSRYEEALMRHLLKYLAGEETDPDSGHPHMAHVAWNALAVQTLKEHQCTQT